MILRRRALHSLPVSVYESIFIVTYVVRAQRSGGGTLQSSTVTVPLYNSDLCFPAIPLSYVGCQLMQSRCGDRKCLCSWRREKNQNELYRNFFALQTGFQLKDFAARKSYFARAHAQRDRCMNITESLMCRRELHCRSRRTAHTN